MVRVQLLISLRKLQPRKRCGFRCLQLAVALFATTALTGQAHADAVALCRKVLATSADSVSSSAAEDSLFELLSVRDLESNSHFAALFSEENADTQRLAEPLNSGAKRELTKDDFSPAFFARSNDLSRILQDAKSQFLARGMKQGSVVLRFGVSKRSAEEIETAKQAFRKSQGALKSLHSHDLRISPEIRRAVMNEATTRAHLYLTSMGVDIKLAYALPEAHLYLELSTEGEHTLNRFAARYSKAHSGALIRFDPLALRDEHTIATFEPSQRIFYVGAEMLLDPKLKDERVLHELFHSLVVEKLSQSTDYTFFGVARAAHGTLPGPEGAYEKFQSLDEGDNYFHTLRNSLSLLLDSIAKGNPEAVRASYARARTVFANGYTTSVRNIHLAELMLKAVESQKFEIRENGKQLGARFQLSEGDNQSEIFLPVTRSGPVAEPDLKAQVARLLQASYALSQQFDLALRVLHRTILTYQTHKDTRIAWFSLKALQSTLRPIDPAKPEGRELEQLAREYNEELQKLRKRI